LLTEMIAKTGCMSLTRLGRDTWELRRLTMIGLHRSGQTSPWLSTHKFMMALCATVLLGVALRIYKLDYQSLWSDEIFSLITTSPRLSPGEFWDRVLADTHPPLYYLLLRLSSSAFGQSELAARAPSAIFGILTLCAAVILPGSSLSRGTRLALALLIATSPGAVWYDREVRSYALLLLLSTLITLACLRFLRSAPDETGKARGAMITLTAAAVLASFTHYFGFLVAAAAFATSFLLTTRRRKTTVGLAGCGVLALFLPWVMYHSQFVDARLTGWIGNHPLSAAIEWFVYLSFGETASVALFVAVAAIFVAIGGWRALAGWNSPIWACTLLSGLTLAAAVVISLHTPILTSRNMIVILPALYVIVAELASCLIRGWGTVAGAVYLATQTALMSQPIADYYTKEMKEGWRDTTALVLDTSGCENGTIHVYGDAAYYRFFTEPVRPRLRLIGIPEGESKDLSHETGTSCPILLWVVGASWNPDDIRAKLGLSDNSFGVADFYEAFVVVRNPPFT
jgi:hypothetical protein